MKKTNILHISQTPLVGAPSSIVESLNNYTTYNASWIFLEDYPEPLKGKFNENGTLFNNNTELCRSLIQNAQIIHIHNALSLEFIDVLSQNIHSDTKFVYQVHNAHREGPIFFNMEDYLPFKFSQKLTVAQHQGRSLPTFTMVPNIINTKENINILNDNEKPKILFLPSHKRNDNRWGTKTSSELEDVLNALHKLKIAELISPKEKLTPTTLIELRKTCHISIDEIFTGSFHRVSMEAFACGNVAINAADDIAIITLMHTLGTLEKPPFYKITTFNLAESFMELVSDTNTIRTFQQEGYEYFQKFMKPEILITHYTNIYNSL